MKDFLNSLSLGSGAAIVAVCSALLAWPLCHMRQGIFRWLGAVVTPLVLAYILYWLPVWLGANPSEYFSWAFLFISTWFLAGIVASLVVVIILGKRHAMVNPSVQQELGEVIKAMKAKGWQVVDSQYSAESFGDMIVKFSKGTESILIVKDRSCFALDVNGKNLISVGLEIEGDEPRRLEFCKKVENFLAR